MSLFNFKNSVNRNNITVENIFYGVTSIYRIILVFVGTKFIKLSLQKVCQSLTQCFSLTIGK